MRRSAARTLLVLPGVVAGLIAPGEIGAQGLPAVVFVRRDSPEVETRSTEELRPAAAPSQTWSELVVRESDGTERVLLKNRTTPPSLPTDFADPDVSHDGERIVFSGYSHAEGAWRIFEVGVNGYSLRQVTRSDRELDPGRLVPRDGTW